MSQTIIIYTPWFFFNYKYIALHLALLYVTKAELSRLYLKSISCADNTLLI